MTVDPEPLDELIAKVAAGDRDAFRQLYDRSSGKLFAVCLGILRQRSLAEDALQEGFVRVWHSAAQFDPTRSAPMTWLISVVRNRALTMRERSARLAPVEDETLEAMAATMNQETTGAAQDIAADSAALQTCLERLADRSREAIRMAYIYGYTRRELARHFGVPAGTVKTWLRRGLMQLKQCLDDERG